MSNELGKLGPVERLVRCHLVAIALLLCSCGTITETGVQDAIKACEPNGGLKDISPKMLTPGSEYSATCNNGLVVHGPTRGT